jgi:fatty acid desaturase
VFHTIDDCEHPLLYLPGTGITSQEIVISGSCQQNLAGICDTVWVWWLFMGWVLRWGSLWMVLSSISAPQKLRLPKIQFEKHMKPKKKEVLQRLYIHLPRGFQLLLYFVFFLFLCFVLLFVLICFVLFCFSRQGFSVQPWLSWNSLCRPGWPQTQKSACFCLPIAGIKGMCHHCLASTLFS